MNFQAFIASNIPLDHRAPAELVRDMGRFSVQHMSYFSSPDQAFSCFFIKLETDCDPQALEMHLQDICECPNISVQGVEVADISKNELYLANIPKEMKDFTFARDFVRSISRTAMLSVSQGWTVVTVSSVVEARQIATFLTGFPFTSPGIVVTDDYMKVPIVHLFMAERIIGREEIQEAVESFADVESVDIVPSKDGSLSANITLSNLEDCDAVVDGLNYAEIEDVQMVVTRFVPVSLLKPLSAQEVRVCGIDSSKSVMEVRNEYSRYGKIFTCRLDYGDDEDTTIAYIIYFDIASACQLAKDPEQDAVMYKLSYLTVYHLDFEMTADDIAELFTTEAISEAPISVEMRQSLQYGDFKSAKVMFRTPEGAKEAAAFGNQQFSGNVKLLCRVAGDKTPYQMQKSTIQVKGMSPTTPARRIVELFGRYGKIEHILRRPKAFYISFCEQEACVRALEDEETLGEETGEEIHIRKFVSKHDVIAGLVPATRFSLLEAWQRREKAHDRDEFFEIPVASIDDEDARYTDAGSDGHGQRRGGQHQHRGNRGRGRGNGRGRGGGYRGNGRGRGGGYRGNGRGRGGGYRGNGRGRGGGH